MTTEDFIIELFCWVDDQMGAVEKHPQAKLYPSELVTIGLLFAFKGGYFRAFCRWLHRDCAALFASLPDRTRLQRLLHGHQDWCKRFLAQPTFFTVIDSYGIELIHPIREKRTPAQIGKKGKSNWRWIVGMKLCWLLNDRGEVVSWAWDTANVHDQVFLPLVVALEDESIVLSDTGFNAAAGIPANLKLCARHMERAHASRNRLSAGDDGLSFEERISSLPSSFSSPSRLLGRAVQCAARAQSSP